MSYDWGHKQAKKDSAGMGFGKEKVSIAVKGHTRAPRSAKAPPKAVPAAQDIPMPKMKIAPKVMAKGGKVKPKKRGC